MSSSIDTDLLPSLSAGNDDAVTLVDRIDAGQADASPKKNGEASRDSDNSDDDDESWQEVTEQENGDDADGESWVICLFCEQRLGNIEPVALEHLRHAHAFDLAALGRRFDMDCYGFIKMINYIRLHKPQPQQLTDALAPLWNDDQYMKPIQFENWLMFDYDELDTTSATDDASGRPVAKTERQQIDDLLALNQQKDALLLEAANDIEQLRTKLRELFEPPATASTSGAKSSLNKLVKRQSTTPCVSDVPVDLDSGYFNSYAHYSIHHEMLSDAVRTGTYRAAIERNATSTIRDKCVLDLGCGTAILSMFAARSGARQVIAVDQSDIIYKAMEVAQRNAVRCVEFVKGRLEDTAIPVKQVDVIVSEWMGYFLLFEGMLDSVIYARKMYLAPGGRMLPNRCNISVVGLADERRYGELIGFWDEVYGFDMSSMRAEVLPEASIEICRADCVVTEPQVVVDLDLMVVTENCVNFESDLKLSVQRDARMTALVGYFDTFFELPEEAVSFSTGPQAQATHWKQTVFYLPEPVEVKAGDVVTGLFKCRRDRKDLRAIFVQIEIFGKVLKYYLN